MSRARHFPLITLLSALALLTACTAQTNEYAARFWNNGRLPAPAAQSPGPLSQSGASSASSAEAEANMPAVKVGILLPLSGQNAQLGEAMLRAAQMAVFDAGHPNFELLPRDTKDSPADAVLAAESALRDGATILLGPVFSASVKAVKPVAARANVNVVAFSTDWNIAGGNVFTMGFLPFDQVERVTRYAASHDRKRIGILTPDTEYGRAVSSAFQATAQRAGANVTGSTRFPPQPGAADSAAADFAARAGSPNAVLIPAGGDLASGLSEALTRHGLPPQTTQRLGTGLWDDPALARAASMEGAWFAAPSPDTRTGFERRFLNNYGTAPPRLSTLAYDATALTAVLARRGLSGGTRPAYDRESILNPNGFAGLDGIFRFRPDGTAERGLAVLEFRGGRIRVLEQPPATFQQPAF